MQRDFVDTQYEVQQFWMLFRFLLAFERHAVYLSVLYYMYKMQ
jgi:hypothetical protein